MPGADGEVKASSEKKKNMPVQQPRGDGGGQRLTLSEMDFAGRAGGLRSESSFSDAGP